MRALAFTAAIALTMSFGAAHAMSPTSINTSGASKATYGPIVPETRDNAALPTAYKASTKAQKTGVEPLRGPWRVTRSLKKKGKVPADENGNTYACMDQACKVSRKVDERRD